MDIQLQLWIFVITGSILFFLLILSNILLISYVIKLYGKLSEKDSHQRSHHEPPLRAYNNPVLVGLDPDELSRRFTQYTPEPTLQHEREIPRHKKTTESNVKSQNIKNVIDVSGEFRWSQDDNFNSAHEGRTYFNDRDYN